MGRGRGGPTRLREAHWGGDLSAYGDTSPFREQSCLRPSQRLTAQTAWSDRHAPNFAELNTAARLPLRLPLSGSRSAPPFLRGGITLIYKGNQLVTRLSVIQILVLEFINQECFFEVDSEQDCGNSQQHHADDANETAESQGKSNKRKNHPKIAWVPKPPVNSLPYQSASLVDLQVRGKKPAQRLNRNVTNGHS